MDTPVPERGQSHVSPRHPETTPSAGRAAPSPALTYFCLSASFLRSEVSAHGALPSTPESGGSAAAASPAAGDVPSLRSAGGHVSHSRAGDSSGGQRMGPSPETPCIPGMLGGAGGDAAGDRRCHPRPMRWPAAGGTFGADELRVLLPGAAEVLQRDGVGLEALEPLQPVLQAPGSLQHRSGVCGTRGSAVGMSHHPGDPPPTPLPACPPTPRGATGTPLNPTLSIARPEAPARAALGAWPPRARRWHPRHRWPRCHQRQPVGAQTMAVCAEVSRCVPSRPSSPVSITPSLAGVCSAGCAIMSPRADVIIH